MRIPNLFNCSSDLSCKSDILWVYIQKLELCAMCIILSYNNIIWGSKQSSIFYIYIYYVEPEIYFSVKLVSIFFMTSTVLIVIMNIIDSMLIPGWANGQHSHRRCVCDQSESKPPLEGSTGNEAIRVGLWETKVSADVRSQALLLFHS